jgi:hypothetical protein
MDAYSVDSLPGMCNNPAYRTVDVRGVQLKKAFAVELLNIVSTNFAKPGRASNLRIALADGTEACQKTHRI